MTTWMKRSSTLVKTNVESLKAVQECKLSIKRGTALQGIQSANPEQVRTSLQIRCLPSETILGLVNSSTWAAEALILPRSRITLPALLKAKFKFRIRSIRTNLNRQNKVNKMQNQRIKQYRMLRSFHKLANRWVTKVDIHEFRVLKLSKVSLDQQGLRMLSKPAKQLLLNSPILKRLPALATNPCRYRSRLTPTRSRQRTLS